MIFRPALRPDRDSIISLHVEISQQAYAQILPHDYLRNAMPTEKLRLWKQRFEDLDDPNTQITVAQHEASVAGFICFQFDHEPEFGSYLHNLYLGRDWRGSGHGRALIRNALDRFDPYRLGHAVHLMAFSENAPARRLYDGLGGTVIEQSIRRRGNNPPVEVVRYQWQSARLLADATRVYHRS